MKVREWRVLGGLGGGGREVRVRVLHPDKEGDEPRYAESEEVDNSVPVHDWQQEE